MNKSEPCNSSGINGNKEGKVNNELVVVDSNSHSLPSNYSYQAPQQNPVTAYLISLESAASRRTMVSFLGISARELIAARIKGTLKAGNITEDAAKSMLSSLTSKSTRDVVHSFDWSLLTRPDIQVIIESLKNKGLAPTTINTYLAALKGVAYEAWNMQLMEHDRYSLIKGMRSVKGHRVPKGRALTMREIKTLYAACQRDKTARGIRDAAIISVLLACGLRRTELVSLNYEDIDFDLASLTVLGKGNKERVAFLTDSSMEKLDAWIEQVRGDSPGPLFTRIRRFDDVTCDRITDQSVQFILNERRLEAGIEKSFSPHDLRRTFASEMLSNGEDLITVKDAMGHSSIGTTERYDHRGVERLQRASKRLKIG